MGAFSDGMNYAWTSPTVPKLQQSDAPFKIAQGQAVWLEVLITIGGLFGILGTLYLVDKIGRKHTIMLASAFGCCGWILIACARTIYLVFLARFIVGMAADAAFVATPMYIAEMADERIRGRLGGLVYVMMLCGVLTVYSVAPFVPIYACALVGFAATTLQMVSFSFMPESPYYSLVRGDRDAARVSLKWLRLKDDVDDELEAISEAVGRQQAERGQPQDLLLVKSNRKAMIIMTVLNAAQHFCGILVILMNLHTILMKAESVFLTENTTGIIFALLMLVFATLSAVLVDYFGRKFLLTTSALLTSLALFLLAAYFTAKEAGIDTTNFSWLPTFAVMFYAAVYRLGVGLVPIIMSAELFPTSVKAMGMTYADAVYVVFACLVLFVHDCTAKVFGLHVPFFVYAVFSVLTAIFCVVYVPETKGKTLEEIQMLLRN